MVSDSILLPADTKESHVTNAHSMIQVYGCVIIYIINDARNTNVWCLDLRNREWYKSKYQMPFTNPYVVVNGMDNFVYFIHYGDEPRGFNFKINLLDIIPSEIYGLQTQENKSLIHGYMVDIATCCDRIFPDTLIDLIVMFYPQLLYA